MRPNRRRHGPKKSVRNRVHKSEAKKKTGSVFQVVGDGTSFTKPPSKDRQGKTPGSVTAEEDTKIGEWIKTLAEGEVGMGPKSRLFDVGKPLQKSFPAWPSRRFAFAKMPGCGSVFRTQKAIRKGWKSKAP